MQPSQEVWPSIQEIWSLYLHPCLPWAFSKVTWSTSLPCFSLDVSYWSDEGDSKG
jgi:hypothetical protein